MLSYLVRKCLFLLGILVPCAALTTNGQEHFKPLLKDGRVWNCIEVYLDEEKNDTLTREYRIEGTSEIDGRICYNLCLGSKLVDRYYEEGPRVYHYTASGWEMLFDFSLSPGDVVPNSGGLVVEEVKTIVMKGVARRCLYFPLTTDDGTRLCWIEGIGSSLHGPYNYNVVIGSLLNVKLQSVYDGDDCIFEPDDFVTKTVKINETTFPDEEFRNWVLAQSYGQDGVLTDEEIANVTKITVMGRRNIQSLKGIEFFTALTTLDCSLNQLTALDLSKNTALTSLYCYCNQLTTLYLSENTALEHLECWENQLTTLDVSQNIALTKLVCADNPLTKIDISNNTKLLFLSCQGNQLKAIDVTKNTELENLNCKDNQLTELDVSKNKELKRLICSNNQLAKLELKNLTKLESLKCFQNRLERIIVSDCPKLWEIDCFNNQIKGEAIDELITGLSVIPEGWGHLCIVSTEDEQNVMTKSQVTAARAKGWRPRYKYGAFGEYGYPDYEGSDDTTPVISPLGETEEGVIYDLQGRKLPGKPARGIYIEDGKKKVMK